MWSLTPTTVGWGSADGFLLMHSMLPGRPTATKSYWRRVRSGRPPCASMRERAFIVGAKPTSKYAVLSVQFCIANTGHEPLRQSSLFERDAQNKKRRLPRETAFCLIVTRKEELPLSLAGLAATYSPRA